MPAVKAEAKPVAKSEPKAAAKPTAKPDAKAAPKSAKPAAKPDAKAAVKTAPKPAAKPADKTAKADAKPAKDKKIKMVRDSISMPKTEYQVLDEMKLRAGKLGAHIKKTELIRAGIKLLSASSDAVFLAALRAVPSLKTGRPAKNA